LGTGLADNIRASGILIPAQKAEDMTAPETRTEPKITLDQRASSRHDDALAGLAVVMKNPLEHLSLLRQSRAFGPQFDRVLAQDPIVTPNTLPQSHLT
jgi:hypothetical protein